MSEPYWSNPLRLFRHRRIWQRKQYRQTQVPLWGPANVQDSFYRLFRIFLRRLLVFRAPPPNSTSSSKRFTPCSARAGGIFMDLFRLRVRFLWVFILLRAESFYIQFQEFMNGHFLMNSNKIKLFVYDKFTHERWFKNIGFDMCLFLLKGF